MWLQVHLDEFVEVMAAKLSKREQEDEIKCMFRAIDARGFGYITFPNLKKAFEEIGSEIPQEVCHSPAVTCPRCFPVVFDVVTPMSLLCLVKRLFTTSFVKSTVIKTEE